MNLDFGAHPVFSWYVVLLLVSGVAMAVMGATNAAGQSRGWRLFNLLAGVGFIGYGVYLGFIFQGGSYLIFFKAFILPAMLVVNFVRALLAQRRVRAARQVQAG